MIHPSGIETSGLPIEQPTKVQVESAARRAKDYYVPRPRYRVNPEFLIKAFLVILFLAGLVKLFIAMV